MNNRHIKCRPLTVLALILIVSLCLSCLSACGSDTASRGAPVSMFYRYSLPESGSRSFSLAHSDDVTKLTVYGDIECSLALSDAALVQAGIVIDSSGIAAWDGFDKWDSGKDAFFELEVRYPDGSGITARGRDRYPRKWEQGHAAICTFFESLLDEETLAEERTVSVSGEELDAGVGSAEIVALDYARHDDGTAAVTGCSGGDSAGIVIPDSAEDCVVTEISTAAFAGSGIESVSMGAYVTTIGDGVCENCTRLRSFELPPALVVIPARAFSGCTSLESVCVPPLVNSVEPLAFFGCTSLREVMLNEGLLSIGRQAFAGCTGLESVNIPYSVNFIADDAFEGCGSDLKLEVYPDSYGQQYAKDHKLSYKVANVKG